MTPEELTVVIFEELLRTDGYVIAYYPQRLALGYVFNVSDNYACSFPLRVVGYGTRADALRHAAVMGRLAAEHGLLGDTDPPPDGSGYWHKVVVAD